MPTVLLVHPDPAPWLAALPGGAPDVTTAATAQAARAYLAGTAFDAVYVGPGVAGAEAIGALRDVLGLQTPVVPLDSAEAFAARVAPGGGSGGSGGEGSAGERVALREIKAELSRVAHALNNPLAVIMGNAQLAQELARAVPTDATVVEAVGAIAEAAGELERLFAEVAALRGRIDRVLGEAGG